MKRSNLTKIILTVGFMVASCAGNQSKNNPELVKPAKSIGSAGTTKPVVKLGAKKPVKSFSAEAEYSTFYTRMAIPENEYTDKDRQMLTTLPSSPSGGTMHEAALVVGLIRDTLAPLARGPKTFKEVDTTPNAGVNTTSPNAVVIGDQPQVDRSRVLETRSRERGVDIISALASNPHLKTLGIYSMAWDASRLEGNSQIFGQNLLTVIKTEVLLWGDLARRLGLETQAVAAVPPTQTEPTTASDGLADGVSPSASPSVSPSATLPVESLAVPQLPVDNVEAAKTLSKAQDLALKENFEKAVIEARKISQGAENYTLAQENIKTWANKSVQDMRRQAANQYRLSSATNDTGGKKAYLNKAKTYLQDALTKYPEASTLDTVKENLEIIEKELEHLK